MAAASTSVTVTAERCRAAAFDGGEHLQVQSRQPRPVFLDEASAYRANDIGHLDGWPLHFLCSFRDRFTWSGLESSTLSSGVPAALIWRSERCR
jgi:hypothetical protein